MSKNQDFVNTLTVFSLNIRSLPNKINKLKNLLSNLEYPPAIICLQEIWSVHGNLTIEGYHPLEFFGRDADSQPNPNCGGGVGIFVRNNIDFQPITIKNSSIKGVLETVWVKISVKGESKIIGSCYRPNTAPLANPTLAINS